MSNFYYRKRVLLLAFLTVVNVFICVDLLCVPPKVMNGKTTTEADVIHYSQPEYSSTNNNDVSSSKVSHSIPFFPLDVKIPDPVVENDVTISISTSEATSLRDILFEISRLSGVDINIDPEIDKKGIINIYNKPLSDVLAAVCRTNDLRYKIERGIIHVYRDLPVIHNYSIDFINVVRKTTSNVRIDTSVISSGGEGGGGGLSSGSSSNINSTYSGSMWEDFEDGLKGIIEVDGNADGEYYSINKQAGIVTIRAKESKQQDIAAYINKARILTSAQVLIEAKVVEVSLNDEYRSGIDWSIISDDTDGKDFSSTVANFDEYILNETNSARINIIKSMGKNGSLALTVDLLERFGQTKTISSPRLNAINNQQAVLSFARNHVYFTLNLEETDAGTSTPSNNNLPNATKININTQMRTVPIGIILSLQPSINIDTNEITMSVRPTVSKLSGTIKDPGTAIIAKKVTGHNLSNEIPIVEVREMDSMLKVQSGQVMVIGGLIENINDERNTGIPFLSKFPVVGNFFKTKKKLNKMVETVIFIKATIVPTAGGMSETDSYMYSDNNNYNPSLKYKI